MSKESGSAMPVVGMSTAQGDGAGGAAGWELVCQGGSGGGGEPGDGLTGGCNGSRRFGRRLQRAEGRWIYPS